MQTSADQSVDMTFQVQQASLDIEQELINHLLIKDDLEYVFRDGLSVDLIYTPQYKAVFNFAKHYYGETGESPTPAVFATEFPDIEVGATQSSVQWVVEKLRERFQRNKVQDLAVKLAESSQDPPEAMRLLSTEVHDLQKKSQSQKHIWRAGDASIFLNMLEEEIMQGFYQGLPTGFAEVDKFTGGLKPGYLAFLAARPKRMKTFFILKAFIEQKRAGHKPILFTLENTDKEIMLRISCLLSGYPWDMAQRGVINEAGWKLLENAWREFDSLGEHFIAYPPADERTVPAMMLHADHLGADSVIISQFNYIQPSNDYYYKRPDHERWASIVDDLKLAATRPGTERPVYVEAQLNREGEKIEDFTEMGLGQLGLTDRIGQASDIVFALFQNKEMRDNHMVQFGIVEARNSDKHNWHVMTDYKNTTGLEMI